MIPANPRFRADHVGSLLRPAALKDAFRDFGKGTLPEADYQIALEDAIKGAIAMQENAGLRSMTDGEFERGSWFGFFFARMDGFKLEPSAFKFRDATGAQYEWPTCVACARIHRKGSITGHEYQRLRRLTRNTPKITMPSPSAFHFFRYTQPADPTVYPDIDAYWDDLVAVYRAEIAELVQLGCDNIQLDEVPLAMLCDSDVRDQVKSMGGDPWELVSRYTDVLNRVLENQPANATYALHLCRGNFRNRWMAAGGYEPIAERLFNTRVNSFFLEFDSERAGDFSPLGFVPKDKSVVLGLISTKQPELESKDALRKRLDAASRFVPLERLAISPQCGFASVAGGNAMTDAQQAAKLGLIADVARCVWPDA
jgi:5-methyltetrahydropteroyltriglutamate--homocysteine methyltransferase